jgi:hypothetical protein
VKDVRRNFIIPGSEKEEIWLALFCRKSILATEPYGVIKTSSSSAGEEQKRKKRRFHEPTPEQREAAEKEFKEALTRAVPMEVVEEALAETTPMEVTPALPKEKDARLVSDLPSPAFALVTQFTEKQDFGNWMRSGSHKINGPRSTSLASAISLAYRVSGWYYDEEKQPRLLRSLTNTKDLEEFLYYFYLKITPEIAEQLGPHLAEYWGTFLVPLPEGKRLTVLLKQNLSEFVGKLPPPGGIIFLLTLFIDKRFTFVVKTNYRFVRLLHELEQLRQSFITKTEKASMLTNEALIRYFKSRNSSDSLDFREQTERFLSSLRELEPTSAEEMWQSCNITSLKLSITDGDNAQYFPSIGKLYNLREFKPKIREQKIPVDLKALSELPKLELIDFSSAVGVDNKNIEQLVPPSDGMPSRINTIVLRNCVRITHNALRHLTRLPHLKNLDLRECSHLDIKAWEEVGKMANLESLDLSECREAVTTQSFSHFKKLHTLQCLKLKNCRNFDNIAFRILTVENNTNAPGDRVRPTRLAASLKELDLLGCQQLTNDALEHISQFANLETLNLKWCGRMTDEGVEHLKKLTKLKTINFKGIGGITVQKIDELEASCPQLKNITYPDF